MAPDSSAQPGQHGQLSDDELKANRLARLYQDLQEVTDLLSARDQLAGASPPITTDTIESARRACLATAVVAYCRAFMKSSGEQHATPKLTLKVLPIGREKWARETHLSLLRVRNKLIAHSDWEYHNTALMRGDPELIGVVRRYSLPVVEPELDVPQFRRLADVMLQQAAVLRADLDRRVLNAERVRL